VQILPASTVGIRIDVIFSLIMVIMVFFLFSFKIF